MPKKDNTRLRDPRIVNRKAMLFLLSCMAHNDMIDNTQHNYWKKELGLREVEVYVKKSYKGKSFEEIMGDNKGGK